MELTFLLSGRDSCSFDIVTLCAPGFCVLWGTCCLPHEKASDYFMLHALFFLPLCNEC
jgi:hypothetical protein